MRGKMNPAQKRVSKEIRAFCKEHAHETQFRFKVCLTGLYDEYNCIVALTESGVVTCAGGGATIEPWRDFPTRTLQKFLNGAKRTIKGKK